MRAAVERGRRPSTARSACSSTTPATASRARSRRSRWTRCAASSRPTCSASCGCASSCCRGCAASAGARSSTSARWAGSCVFPGGGFYHATKYAVEAISDALRFEVKGFGVDVILIEPGLIRTAFGETASGGVAEASPARATYAQFNAARRARDRERLREGRPVGRLGGPPEAVAKVIEKALDRAPAARPLHASRRRRSCCSTQRALLPDRGVGRASCAPSSRSRAHERRRAPGRARRPRGTLRDRHGVHARGPLPAAAVPRAGLRRRRDRGARPVRGLRPRAVRRGARRPRRPGRAARRPPGRGDHAPRVAHRASPTCSTPRSRPGSRASPRRRATRGCCTTC